MANTFFRTSHTRSVSDNLFQEDCGNWMDLILEAGQLPSNITSCNLISVPNYLLI